MTTISKIFRSNSLFKFFCWLILVAPLASVTLAASVLNEANVEEWADQLFTEELSQKTLSGAIVSVVKQGQVILNKGYGVARAGQPQGVEPDKTLFRIGSITKTFTATLVAKLINNGSISSIDDPVNLYLKRYQLPDNNGTKITLRHLLTHTAGFEDRFYFLGSEKPQIIPIPAEVFDQMRPPFIRPAGHSVVYSNFGVAVLGLMLEDQMGGAINELIRQHIFSPLDMTNSQLLVDTKAPDHIGVPATFASDGSVSETKFVAINPAAAQTGSIVSTGNDMAKYMLAYLDAGRSSTVLLTAAGFDSLTQPYAGNAKQLPSLGMVWFLDRWAGQKTISHGGNWVGFHSQLLMLPDTNVGVFVSTMSEAATVTVWQRFLTRFLPGYAEPASTGGSGASRLTRDFLQHFLGAKQGLSPVIDAPLQDFVGHYQADRRAMSNAEVLGELVYFGAGLIDVTVQNNRLYLSGSGPWRHQGNGFFVNELNRAGIVFKVNPSNSEMQLVPSIGVYTYSQVAPLMRPVLHVAVVLLCGVLAVLFLLAEFKVRSLSRCSTVLRVMINTVILLLPLSVFWGYEHGYSMMNDLYAGNLQRVKWVLGLGNMLLLAWLLVMLRQWSQRAELKLLTVAVSINAGFFLLILFHYHGLGWSLPGPGV